MSDSIYNQEIKLIKVSNYIIISIFNSKYNCCLKVIIIFHSYNLISFNSYLIYITVAPKWADFMIKSVQVGAAYLMNLI